VIWAGCRLARRSVFGTTFAVSAQRSFGRAHIHEPMVADGTVREPSKVLSPPDERKGGP